MKLLAEQLRNRLFWVLDALKGDQVNAHYKDIADILENFDSPESKNRRDTLLKQLLRHARGTTPFYRKFGNLVDLQDFPVLNKTLIRDNFQALQSSGYIKSPKHEVSTSGSSGTPFKAVSYTHLRAH